jgi:FkbM family methyltransferase
MPDTPTYPSPDLEHLDPADVPRVLMTVSCRDTDRLPKVAGAGSFIERDGKELQVMHNGLLIERGCYYGPWTDEIIRALGGHHEPQEELVFYRILERLAQTAGPKCSIEFGSFWAYYSMWFAHDFPGARSIALEPDPAYLEIGKRNAKLNGLQDAITFGHGAVGSEPGSTVSFVAESDKKPYEVKQYDLESTMEEFDLDHVDVLMVDIQGFEEVLLPRAIEQFKAGKVRFLIVSTHHHFISLNPATHQQMLALLLDAGAHVIAEHSVSESYSGDGLIAVSFDERDDDLVVEVSHNRSRDSLFPDLEEDFAQNLLRLGDTQRELIATRAAMQTEVDAARAELAAMRNSRLYRWSAPVRTVYGRLRSRLR